MSGIHKILAVTSGRADASPIRPVIEALEAEGANVGEVSLEGLDIETCCRSVADSLCYGYDSIILLGDRYEILAAALAATVAQIPIAHIHGGEASFGSFDNQIRDAITKLSHIHFVATEGARQRLAYKLDESPERIHLVGAPGLDNIAPILKEERKPGKYFVVTWHPETLGDEAGCRAMIEALRQFPDYEIKWTNPNNDPGSSDIIQIIDELVPVKLEEYTPTEYLRAVYNCAAVIGNSSSGIIEAPTLGAPTVNIGTRQDGREKANSILPCEANVDDIVRAINLAISGWHIYTNPYGTPGASAKIADILMGAEIEMVKRHGH